MLLVQERHSLEEKTYNLSQRGCLRARALFLKDKQGSKGFD
jgi:hypothetical protein